MQNETFKEAFLHYVWRFQYFDKKQLQSHQGEEVHILSPGFLNTNAGPDFQQSRITLDGIAWHGHVEIHYKASDWLRHQHAKDAAYNNVVLHVVWENDIVATRQDGSVLPTLELKGRVDKRMIEQFETLVKNPVDIPCSLSFDTKQIEPIFISSMLERSLVERLENKTEEIAAIHRSTKNDWEETVYRWLGKCYGFKINSLAFLKLCEVLPYSLIKKYKQNTYQTEALLFGCAGFLNGYYESDYPKQLQKEFEYISHKHNINNRLHVSEWKFLRLRPANFPTLRIAQFARFISSTHSLYDLFFTSFETSKFIVHTSNAVHPYWKDHYLFDKTGTQTAKDIHMGKVSAENLVINALLPLRFTYAQLNGKSDIKTETLETFRNLPKEQNSVLGKYAFLPFKIESAYESQAFIQLHNAYCMEKRCLSCHIGHQLIHPS